MSRVARLPDETVESALKHLRSCDPVMRDVIDRVGPFTLRLEPDRFRMLVRSIISQQISTQAARTIRGRLEQLLKPRRLTPENVANLKFDDLRAAGLSAQKAGYILDLAARVLAGDIRLRQLGRMADEEVIDELIRLKGVGRWTAQMFLIFCLGRPDVFPHDDLGIRSALRNLYELDDLPDKLSSLAIAAAWQPYSSIASWYCWRSGDAQKVLAADYPV